MKASIKEQLLVLSQWDDIAACVAEEALCNSYENACDFFSDLANYGCCSGMISSLIYYYDTAKFFDTHYAEIEEMRQELALEGIDICLTDWDLKNHMVWFAFEEVAYRLADGLGVYDAGL